MGRGLGLAVVVAIGILSVGPISHADQINDLKAAALAGSYPDQRNYAYSLEQGLGVPKNTLEACVWRLIISFTQNAKVTSGDVSNVEHACSSPLILDAALPKANELTKQMSSLENSKQNELLGLSENICPGPTCAERYPGFENLFNSAIKGEVASIRDLALCLSGKCANGTRYPWNDFQACVWSNLLLASLGQGASQEDGVLAIHNCISIKSPISEAVLDHHSRRILQIMTSP